MILMNCIEEVLDKNVVEIIGKDKLYGKQKLSAYVGFEPSGFMHIGSLILLDKMLELKNCGVDIKILIADYFAYLNNKLGGRWRKIGIASEYMKKMLLIGGFEESDVIFTTDDIVYNKNNYFSDVLTMSKKVTLDRTIRGIPQYDRDKKIKMSNLLYVLMQSNDIHYLDVDIVLGGMDQRKIHMFAIDSFKKLGWKIPTFVHTPLISSLNNNGRMDVKMSKSNKTGIIYLHDSVSKIEDKINSAYCPPKELVNNPVYEIFKYVLKFGDDRFDKGYKMGIITPKQLKQYVIEGLWSKLKPYRDWYIENRNKFVEMEVKE